MQPSSETEVWRVTGPEIMETDRYLSSANAPDIEEDIRLCVESGARNMILNCASLSYATGAGMRAFITIARMLEKVGGTFAVQGLKGQPLEIFIAAGLDDIIPIAAENSLSYPSPIQLHSI